MKRFIVLCLLAFNTSLFSEIITGLIDPTFGTAGVALDSFAGFTQALGLCQVIDPTSGTIWVGGTVDLLKACISQFNPSGHLQQHNTYLFGSNSSSNILFVVRQFADRQLALGGNSTPGGNSNMVVARVLTSNLMLDPAFAAPDGFLNIQPDGPGTSASGQDMLIDSEDRALIVGNSNNNVALARVTPGGSLDTTFNASGPQPGTISLPIGVSSSQGIAVALQSNGNSIVVLAAQTTPSANTTYQLARFRGSGPQAGTLDPTFGTGGVFDTGIATGMSTGGNQTASVLIQADDSIVWLGATGQNSNFIMQRVFSDGSGIDPAFGTAGSATIALAGSFNLPPHYAVTQDNNGNIILFLNLIGTIVGMRFSPDGLLDTSFGTRGFQAYTLGVDAACNGIGFQDATKLVASGFLFTPISNPVADIMAFRVYMAPEPLINLSCAQLAIESPFIPLLQCKYGTPTTV